MRDNESRICDAVLSTHAFQVGLPALSIRWIGEHEVELLRSEAVLRQCGTISHVFRFAALTLKQQVSLSDCVGFRIDFLAVEVNGHIFAVFASQRL